MQQQLWNTGNPALQLDGNYVITDQYHVSSMNMPNSLGKDIIFPMTTGRKFMQIGAEHDDNTSFGATFSDESPHENIIYARTYDEFWSDLSDLSSILKANPLHSVSCLAFVISNVRIQFALVGHPQIRHVRSDELVVCKFTMNIYKYRA